MGRKPTALALVTDAFGGRGGIALYNRHFLRAICSYPGFAGCEAIARVVKYGLEAMPDNLRYRHEVAGGKIGYIAAAAGLAARRERAPVVFCSHLHLLPLAYMIGLRHGCPVVPLIYGVEAWTPTGHPLADRLCGRLKELVGIRRLTANRLMSWARNPGVRFHYLPNCIDLSQYGTGPRRGDLIARYSLEGATVIMTAGRMDTSPREMNKGFDEVLSALPLLARDLPSVRYVIMGDGDDRGRLERKARDLGIAERVVFTGYVPEADKADHYRLADVVAMPGSHASFDTYPFRFAFLEPLACGIPVVGTRLEDASERDDPDAKELIVQVDPTDPADIRRGILDALESSGRGINPRLAHFSYEAFEASAHAIFDLILGASQSADVPSQWRLSA